MGLKISYGILGALDDLLHLLQNAQGLVSETGLPLDELGNRSLRYQWIGVNLLF